VIGTHDVSILELFSLVVFVAWPVTGVTSAGYDLALLQSPIVSWRSMLVYRNGLSHVSLGRSLRRLQEEAS